MIHKMWEFSSAKMQAKYVIWGKGIIHYLHKNVTSVRLYEKVQAKFVVWNCAYKNCQFHKVSMKHTEVVNDSDAHKRCHLQ